MVSGQKSCVVDVILASILNKKVIFISHAVKHRSKNKHLVFQDISRCRTAIPGQNPRILGRFLKTTSSSAADFLQRWLTAWSCQLGLLPGKRSLRTLSSVECPTPVQMQSGPSFWRSASVAPTHIAWIILDLVMDQEDWGCLGPRVFN